MAVKLTGRLPSGRAPAGKRFARWAQCLYRVSLMAGDWAGTRVLFTGAQGFIGSWVAERLLDEDAELFVLDRPTAELSRFRMRGLHDRCTPVPAELEDAASLCRTLDRARHRGGVPPRGGDDRGVGDEVAAQHLRGECPRHLEPAGGLPHRPRTAATGGCRLHRQGVRDSRESPLPRGSRAAAAAIPTTSRRRAPI